MVELYNGLHRPRQQADVARSRHDGFHLVSCTVRDVTVLYVMVTAGLHPDQRHPVRLDPKAVLWELKTVKAWSRLHPTGGIVLGA